VAISKKRDELNMELMRVLEEETQAEAMRENKLKQTIDETEQHRLEKIFGIERAKASERIIQTSDRHDAILRKEMESLGITF
jgi:DNA integrity scanning protein DisA with diadenylate cyclase activity